jgi:hypothetical protein
MQLRKTLNHLLQRLRGQRDVTQSNLPQTQSNRMIKGLMHALELTEEGDYTCEEAFELLDEYAELVSSGEDVAQVMPLIKRHLDLCRDCREEYEALLRVLESKVAETE